jgi:hypothetical protein
MKYVSWTDLFTQWVRGADSLTPARGNWDLRVEAGMLYRGAEVVGVPMNRPPPRPFWYLVSAWRRRYALRVKLEEHGGIPCMPFELAGVLVRSGRAALSPKGTDTSDPDGYDFILRWLTHSRGFIGGMDWRDYRIQAQGQKLELGQKFRGQPRTTTIARRKDGALELLGHVGRSPGVLWVRDAVYVALGRLVGAGLLQDPEVRMFDGSSKKHWEFKPVKVRAVDPELLDY